MMKSSLRIGILTVGTFLKYRAQQTLSFKYPFSCIYMSFISVDPFLRVRLLSCRFLEWCRASICSCLNHITNSTKFSYHSVFVEATMTTKFLHLFPVPLGLNKSLPYPDCKENIAIHLNLVFSIKSLITSVCDHLRTLSKVGSFHPIVSMSSISVYIEAHPDQCSDVPFCLYTLRQVKESARYHCKPSSFFVKCATKLKYCTL